MFPVKLSCGVIHISQCFLLDVAQIIVIVLFLPAECVYKDPRILACQSSILLFDESFDPSLTGRLTVSDISMEPGGPVEGMGFTVYVCVPVRNCSCQSRIVLLK